MCIRDRRKSHVAQADDGDRGAAGVEFVEEGLLGIGGHEIRIPIFWIMLASGSFKLELSGVNAASVKRRQAKGCPRPRDEPLR